MGDPKKAQSNVCCGGGAKTKSRQACTCTQSTSAMAKPTAWVMGQITTEAGAIPQIATRLTLGDKLGSWKARWDMGRMDYKVPPGLYAVGNPDSAAPVLVSANYKMSFDRLRQELGGLNLWIMVLDTKGINVWCAAGKGTFGTEELVKRIASVKLAMVVTHRKLVLPQLGAPGVAAHEVLKASGFKVVYGPVRAEDLRDFLQAGMKATAAMREVHFGVIDRLVLAPLELVEVSKPLLILWGLLFGGNLIFVGAAEPFNSLLGKTMSDFFPYLGAGLTGSVLVPVLLPYIPGRALAWKGWLLGLLWTGVYLRFITPQGNWLGMVAYLLLLPSIVSYLAMNFTGATTYTSLSGVVKEMRIALPAQIISVGMGIFFLMANLLMKF